MSDKDQPQVGPRPRLDEVKALPEISGPVNERVIALWCAIAHVSGLSVNAVVAELRDEINALLAAALDQGRSSETVEQLIDELRDAIKAWDDKSLDGLQLRIVREDAVWAAARKLSAVRAESPAGRSAEQEP